MAQAGTPHGIIVGTAGWSIARDQAEHFAAEGSALQRYASRLGGVEINTSFYRRHKLETWQRWHNSAPENFAFAVKTPKRITHELMLANAGDELRIFLGDIAPLGKKLGPLLVQLPPALAFDAAVAQQFFGTFRHLHSGRIVLEARHGSWGSPESEAVLADHGIERVYADPDRAALNAAIDGKSLGYLRLHGSPKIYYSSYSDEQIVDYAQLLRGGAPGAWCIFDNTASGAALRNALTMLGTLAGE